jgi:hypothetical protein
MHNKYNLITRSELINTGIKIKKYSSIHWFYILNTRPAGDLGTDLFNNINRLLNLYQHTINNHKNNFGKNIIKHANELLELINYDGQMDFNLPDDKLKKIGSSKFIASISSHNDRLDALNDLLKKQGISTYSVVISLSKLVNTLSSSGNKLDQEKYKDTPSTFPARKQSDIDIEFIQALHSEYKYYTQYSDKVTYNDIDNIYSGIFFKIIELCFKKAGKNTGNSGIKKLILKANLS